MDYLMSVSKPGNGEDRSKSIERKGLDIQVQHECKTRVKCHGNRKSPNPVKSSHELFMSDISDRIEIRAALMFCSQRETHPENEHSALDAARRKGTVYPS
jgi:hypothetical protein